MLVVALWARPVSGATTASASPVGEAPHVVVLPPLCEASAIPLIAFVDALRVELSGAGLTCCALGQPDEPSRGPSLVVAMEPVPCAGGAELVRIAVRPPDGSRAVERDISLADVAVDARARTLALAVAELVRLADTRWSPVPPEPAAPPPPPAPAPPAKVAPPVRLTAQVEAEGRGMSRYRTVLWGGRMRLVARRGLLHGSVDLGANDARAQQDLGQLSLRSASLGFGLGPSFATHAGAVDLGLHGELGWGWVRGQTTVPDVQARAGSGAISTVGLRASFEGPPAWRARPVVALEGGGVVRSLTAEVDGHPAEGIAGFYVLCAVGLAVSP